MASEAPRIPVHRTGRAAPQVDSVRRDVDAYWRRTRDAERPQLDEALTLMLRERILGNAEAHYDALLELAVVVMADMERLCIANPQLRTRYRAE